ncbi:HEPN domain-containing protein [uncultured Pluralibacter sp.]|uniref:HEPN domain-containing protein n=1 Tax=uncultured Pluralibacter sp. TaxID=1490864 RepID=UPI00262C5F07|nr:HEPN domain-containing protein [uncultured Pluralibacter sp.]
MIHVQEKCSKELSLQLAEKTKNTTFNVLKLLATHLSPNTVPLFTSNDKVNCAYDFYCYGKNNESMDSVTKFRFPYFQFDSKAFWDIITNKGEEPNLIDIAFQFVELLLTPHFKNERVVDRLERSLMWYGDSVTDQINYQQIQKLVSSLEALVNFRDDNVTEVFKRRVANLNITYSGVDFDIENKAKQLYDARSKIVHGSSLDVKLEFCLIKFCSETILRAIYYFSIFGFGKTNFNITLPTFLDDIPKNAILE